MKLSFSRINQVIFSDPKHNEVARSLKTGEIIPGYEQNSWTTGIRHFQAVTVKQILLLRDLILTDEDGNDIAWNSAPSQGEFIDFMTNNSGFTCIGHTTSPKRGYVEILLTGIDFHGSYTPSQVKIFKKFSKTADEKTLVPGYMRAWWD